MKLELPAWQLGFTLPEVVLSISVIAILAGITVPIFQQSQVRNDLEISATTVSQSLRRAQSLAQAVDGDTSWGVKVMDGTITLFKGVSFATRDASRDEIFNLANSISVTGSPEVIFSKLTGLANAVATITINSNIGETRTVTINEKGMVSY